MLFWKRIKETDVNKKEAIITRKQSCAHQNLNEFIQ